MKHSDLLYLGHMFDACMRVNEYLNKVDRPRFDADHLLQDGVIRQLEIVGEAGGRVSPSFRASHPDIPWADVKEMRNALIHGYARVDLDVVWRTATEDVPPLLAELERVVREIDLGSEIPPSQHDAGGSEADR